MYALIIGLFICIGGLVYAFATAKRDPSDESKGIPEEYWGYYNPKKLDEHERAISEDIPELEECQNN